MAAEALIAESTRTLTASRRIWVFVVAFIIDGKLLLEAARLISSEASGRVRFHRRLCTVWTILSPDRVDSAIGTCGGGEVGAPGRHARHGDPKVRARRVRLHPFQVEGEIVTANGIDSAIRTAGCRKAESGGARARLGRPRAGAGVRRERIH